MVYGSNGTSSKVSSTASPGTELRLRRASFIAPCKISRPDGNHPCSPETARGAAKDIKVHPDDDPSEQPVRAGRSAARPSGSNADHVRSAYADMLARAQAIHLCSLYIHARHGSGQFRLLDLARVNGNGPWYVSA